jgi:hypothetical protein
VCEMTEGVTIFYTVGLSTSHRESSSASIFGCHAICVCVENTRGKAVWLPFFTLISTTTLSLNSAQERGTLPIFGRTPLLIDFCSTMV